MNSVLKLAVVKMNRSHSFKLTIIFCFSCVLGALFALIWRKYLLAVHISAVMKNYGLISLITHYNSHDEDYLHWLQSHGLQRESYNAPWREGLLNCDKDLLEPGESMTEACRLRELVPVVCIVLTTSETIDYAQAIRESWGTHCNKLVTFAPDESTKSWTIGVMINDDSDMKTTWSMLCQSLFYSYVEFESQHSWFFVVTDETFAIPENLRYLLAIYNASKPYYFGHSYRKGDEIYNTLQGGIVLSREALKLLHQNASLHNSCSKQKLQRGDVVLSQLLMTVNVPATDTRDHLGRGLFNMFETELHLIPNAINWFQTDHFYRSLHLSLDGAGCCSDYAITFHAGYCNEIKVLYYMTYRLTPYGIASRRPTQNKVSDTKSPDENRTIKKKSKKNQINNYGVQITESPKIIEQSLPVVNPYLSKSILTNEIPDTQESENKFDSDNTNETVFDNAMGKVVDTQSLPKSDKVEVNDIENIFTSEDDYEKL